MDNSEDVSFPEDLITKKVCFKESKVITDDVMAVEDYNSRKVIFGHYLTVQPWTIDFNPSLPYPNLVLTWIRFPGLPSHLYQKQILMEIGGMVDQVKDVSPSSVHQQEQHIVHFNPTFEENSLVNVVVNEGVLDVNNHSAVIFKRNSVLEPANEEIEDSFCPSKVKASRKVLIGQSNNSKVSKPKGGWKLNKTLKGPDNRFKNSKNTGVYFAKSMKRVVKLIAAEIDGESTGNFSCNEGECGEYFNTEHR
ncbi:hypothetical protein J1N35_024742 [Gossypium stocksii]|uniref:DUF4283 domain-containing protein n=1 Tax=Gossypium stocksii TaxID=47602 RepID=A0A9D3V544_9ROSI|nr:hypothetical protein J1N35_024742 [Gossypium stocksii]